MKLSKTMKDQFFNAVYAEIEQVDYDEQARVFIQADALAQLPVAVRKAHDAGFGDYLHRCYFYRCNFSSISVYTSKEGKYTPSIEASEKIQKIATLKNAQTERLIKAREAIRSMIEPFNTLKAATENLPTEFHKYLPTDEAKPINVPAILMAEAKNTLVSLGWKGAQHE